MKEIPFNIVNIKQLLSGTTFMCWHCENKRKRIAIEDAVIRVEGFGHINFACPKCERVIMCIDKTRIKQDTQIKKAIMEDSQHEHIN